MRKKSIKNVLSILLMFVSFAVLFYPVIANYIASQQNRVVVLKYRNELDNASEKSLNDLLIKAQIYNKYIFSLSQFHAWKQPVPNYKEELVVDGSQIMGYLDIPQIKLNNVPIYHGDSIKTLEEGVGHIEQTSLPVGGINTHSVLSAHSGQVNNALFSDLQNLKIGDTFVIRVLNSNLKYKIYDRRIIKPDETSFLNVSAGKDLVTLMTCWPTGINNKRLLVTGYRIPYHESTSQEKTIRNQYGYSFWLLLGSLGTAFLGILWLILALVNKRKHIVRVDCAQFDDLQSRNQKMIIVTKGLNNLDRNFAYSKYYKLGDRITIKAWEIIKNSKTRSTNTYFRKKNNSWESTSPRKAEVQRAEIVWIADSIAINNLFSMDSKDLSEKKFESNELNMSVPLSEIKKTIYKRLGTETLPSDCVCLGIELQYKKVFFS